MKDTFQTITDDKRLAYEYIRGSHLYNLQNESSDIDTSGVFIAPKNSLIGLGFDYQAQVSDERHDTTWFEVGDFCNLLLKSNPTVLEALFVPESKIITPPSDIIMPLFENRDQFITKQCFNPFIGYAKEQIKKARGLNKKIVNPVTERLSPFDFAYTFYNQGSTKISNWLANRGLDKDYCGLVHIPNMHDTYGVYYDWGAHLKEEEIDLDYLEKAMFGVNPFGLILFGWFGYGNISEEDKRFAKYIQSLFGIKNKKQLAEWYEKHQEVIHYRGMCLDQATDMRGSSVSKGEKPLCHMVFNESGFKDHCKKYKEYKDWEKNRNPKRYESNLNKNYDCYLESETEFLTNNGWKKYDEITENDLLGCFNDSHSIEYHKYLDRFSDDYSGEIYTYNSPYVRFSVTPNHKLYLSPCHRVPSNNYSTKYDSETAKWELIKVSDFMSDKRSYYHQLSCLANNNEDNKDFSDDFIKLLGMFLTEGCFIKNKKTNEKVGVRIAQTNGRCGCEVMESIKEFKINKYVYNYKKRNKGDEYAYDCLDSSVLDRIVDCGDGALHKDIPSYVYTFSKRQFDLFLNVMICGDGTFHKKKGHRVFYTYSESMAKTLHTLLILNGYNAQVYGGKKGSYCKLYESSFKRKDGAVNPSYQVFISKIDSQYHVLNKTHHWDKREVKNERIVCFQTPYGTLVTRNNNKVAFHGNSKNMMHTLRLMHMGKEIAEGQGVILERTWDRDFLMDVRNHKFEYDELMEIVERDNKALDEAIANSTIKENIDVNFVNDLLIDIRKKAYGW